MKRLVLSVAVVFAAIFSATDANAQNQFPPMFSNQTHSAEALPFADLSQQIWDLMAAKDADALKEIFHPNAMFVHMGGYWDCAGRSRQYRDHPLLCDADFYPRRRQMVDDCHGIHHAHSRTGH